MRVLRFIVIAILLSATCAQAQTARRQRHRHVTAPLDQLRKANAARPVPHQTTAQPFMYEPAGLAFDSSGNLYVAAPFLNEVLKVTTGGSLSIIAGTETAGFSGDGGPAVDAELDEPFGVAVDSAGDVFIADSGNSRVREVTTDGMINTVAGGASAACSGTDSLGDGCPAVDATLSFVFEVAIDSAGNLLIADSGNGLVRKVTMSGQMIITIVAGGGSGSCTGATDNLGDGCQATQAILEQPRGLAADTHGNIYIGDIDTATVRVVNSSGVISLYAGNFEFGFTANGVAATSTTLDNVEDLALDSNGDLFIADAVTNEIREVNATTHIISDAAGNIFGLDAYAGDGGPATSATFEFVWGVAVSPTNGQLYISDIDSNQIRFVNFDSTFINTFVAPTLSEPQAFVQFDKQITNTASSIVSVTLTNTSGAPITIASIAISNPVYTDDGNTCVDTNAPIPAGGTCQINFTWTPTTVCDVSSANDATITISHDGPGGASFVFLSGEGAGTPGITTDDLTDTDLSAAALAQQLVGSGVTISNVTYTGAPQAAGTFSGGQNIIGFNSGVILSNGAVANVIGPNCSVGITRDNGLPGDTDLQTLLGANAAATTDAAVLEFDFVPVGDTLNFQYVWSSDEYTEEVGAFDDVFAFFVNGSDAALVPGTNVPVSVNTINNGNSVDPSIPVSNPEFFIDNDIQYPSTAPLNTEMDGLTVVLSVTVPVNQGVTNHIKLAIADTGDHIYDSNVFLAAGSVNSSPLDLSVGTLAFGNQALNTTSPPQTVTITNAGTSTVDISSITASAGYADTSTCGETIISKGTCNVTVTFTPTATGFIQGLLTITSDANGPNTMQTVGLSGTGVNPLTITLPASVTFPATPINTTSSPMAVTVLNNSSSVANLVITSAGSAAPFAVSGGTCPTGQPGIAPSASCTIQMTFTPTTTSPSSGSLVLTDNASGSPQSVPLMGTTTSQTISVSVTPTTVNFPATPQNQTSSPISVTVKNTSTGGGTVSFTAISAGDGGPFAVSGGTCSTDSEPLPAGSSCTIAVTFTPTGTAPSSGTLTISDNAANSPQNVTLNGTTTSTTPTVSVTPTSLTFPPTPQNQASSPMSVTVNNTTQANISVSFTQITASGPFAITGGNCSTETPIGGEGSCTIAITFTPTGTAPSSGTLTIADNATGSPQTVALSGTTQSAQTFTLSVGGNGSSTVTVSPGDTAIFPVVLTPSEGVTGVVNLTCTPSTPTITCKVTPTSITLTGSGAVDTGISVVTFCSWAPPGGGPTSPWNGPSNGPLNSPWRYAIPVTSLLGLLLALVTFARSKRRRWVAAFAAVAFMVVGVAGCKNLPKGPDGRTPPGTYTLTLTGTLNGQSQSLQFTLIVN